MNSFSLLPCRTSRPWHFEPSDHHRHGGAHRLPEIAHQCASSVRVEVAGNHAAAKSNGPAQLSRFKTTQQHNANRKTYFLNSIDVTTSTSIVPTPFGVPDSAARQRLHGKAVKSEENRE